MIVGRPGAAMMYPTGTLARALLDPRKWAAAGPF